MNFQNIPEVMQNNALWCVWKMHTEKGKIPFSPVSGAPSQSNNSSTFADFDAAIAAYRTGNYNGLGIGIFNGFAAIDIDHCISDGQLSDIAKDIIDTMGSYTEISPSGTGIRIIFTVENFKYNTERYYIHNQKRGLEIYVSGATNKFVTITGNVFKDAPVKNGNSTLPVVLEKYMQRPTPGVAPSVAVVVSDKDYLRIGLEKDKKLKAYWNGSRLLEDKSESENDMAFLSKLLYWTNGDKDAAIQAFLSSPYVSQKDDAHKKKLDRADYLPRVVNAITLTSTAAADDVQSQQQHKVSAIPTFMSAKDLQKAILPPVEYLVDDFLPVGTSILSAASKIGKSWLVLDMGLKIASGSLFMEKQSKRVGVLYFALEDSYTRLQSRMEKLLNGAEAPDGFYFAVDAPTMDNQFLDCIKSYLIKDPNIKLLIIDTLQKVRGQARSGEPAYQQDYREMGKIKKFADQYGISVLFVHHNRKMKDDSDPFNMISGTTGIMGAADTALVITKKNRESKDATLHITGRDVEQSDLTIRFNSECCRWELVGNAEEIKTEELKQTYRNSPIIKAVKALLQNSPDGKWDGNAKKLMDEGVVALRMPVAHSSQAVGNYLASIPVELLADDGIGFSYSKNGNAGYIYHFWFLPREEFDDVEF